MTTPGAFAFGNDLDGFEPTITRGAWFRSVEKTGHPPNWRPDHYRSTGALPDGDSGESFKPQGRRAHHVRSSA